MTSMQSGSEVLKLDVRGRAWTPRERRDAVLDEFERSGMSGAQFARLSGIKYQTLMTWIKKRRKAAGGAVPEVHLGSAVSGTGAIELFEAEVRPEGGAIRGREVSGLAIELPGGSRIVVGSPMQLQMAAELVAMVAQRVRSC